MDKIKLNRNLRIGIVFLLVLFTALAAYFNYSSTIPHTVLAGYTLKSEMSIVTQGLLYTYPIGENKLLGYTNVSRPVTYLGLYTYAYVKSSILYDNATVVYNQTYYFLKLTKILFLKFNASNISYNIYISTPYYNVSVIQGLANNGVIPVNVTGICSLYNKLENETGVYVQPTINVVVNNSAIVAMNVNGYVISVHLVRNTITHIIKIPVYGKLVSLDEYPISQLITLYLYPTFYPKPLSVNYSLLIQIDNFNFTLEQNSYSSPIALNITKLYSIASNFTSIYDLTPTTPIIYLNFTAKYSNFTFKPYIEIIDNNGMIQVLEYNNSITYPVYETTDSDFNYFNLIYVILPLTALVYLLLFTQGISPSPLDIIMKKYKKVIIMVNDPPPSEKKMMRVNNFSELLKLSQILAKPIIANGNKLWIHDENLVYMYEFS
ncbi:DUF5305 family protein [Sulfurisphaera tokodaii]|uniref:Uncharacterized protein n=2 Tax=Sulfurisphaera tokodaii TaxID=111955 RepID=Q970P3_SULTO|nr:DUF5305 family protein [Sulfurisphaera tokodaii]BAB66630.1 hypothetical protein STK_15570 [Sulfurisphaera tokodaii str. 7]HII73550.1 DUF5305 domain-containing protein [Sulfurisphaera tokodaii]